jgi:hypothetical protein
MSLADAYRYHVALLEQMAERGDEIAEKSLACIALAEYGWKPGDPDPEDEQVTGNVIDLRPHLERNA